MEQNCAQTGTLNRCGIVSTSHNVPHTGTTHNVTHTDHLSPSSPNTPPPPPSTDHHLPSSGVHGCSSSGVSQSMNDLHHQVLEFTTHTSASGDTTAENPALQEISDDDTYLDFHGHSNGLRGDELTTGSGSGTSATTDELSAASGFSTTEVVSHNVHVTDWRIYTPESDDIKEEPQSKLRDLYQKKAGNVQNANSLQQGTPTGSCKGSDMHFSFVHNLGKVLSNLSVEDGEDDDCNDSTHLSESMESPVSLPGCVLHPTSESKGEEGISSVGDLHFNTCKASELASQCRMYSGISPRNVVDSELHCLKDVTNYSIETTRSSCVGLKENLLMENKLRDLASRDERIHAICDLPRFQPVSFSTPFKSTCASQVHFQLHPKQKDLGAEGCEGGGSDGDDCSTRLDWSHVLLNHSTTSPGEVLAKVGYTTPSRGTVTIPVVSPHKSILKKRNGSISQLSGGEASSSHCSAGRGHARCVTFNISPDPNVTCDDSSILATETPRCLWHSSNTLDCINEMVEDTWSESCARADLKDEIEGVHCNYLEDTCILAMETPVHMWTAPPIKYIDSTM